MSVEQILRDAIAATAAQHEAAADSMAEYSAEQLEVLRNPSIARIRLVGDAAKELQKMAAELAQGGESD